MTRAYIGVGSNIEPRKHIRHALHLLGERFGELTVSPVYASAAVGFDGADFLNLVVGMDVHTDAPMLLQGLHCIEEHCGRERKLRTASRSMDLDLLLFGEMRLQTPELTLPRNDILRYAFVLKPLADIAGAELHPVQGSSYSELWAGFDAQGQDLHAVDLD